MTHPHTNASAHLAKVERRKGTVWYLRGRIGGKTVQKRLGNYWPSKRGPAPPGYLTANQAEQARIAWLADAARGTVAAHGRSGANFADGVAEWIRYARDDRRVRVSTLSDYRLVAERDLLRHFNGSAPIEAITPKAVEAYKAKLLAAGQSPRTVNKKLQNLGAVFKRAQRVWPGVPNPVAEVERIRERHSGDFQVLRDSDLCFVGNHGGHLDGSALRRRFKVALAKAGLPELRLHDLRHTCATMLVRAFSLPTVMQYLGHADIQTTQRYLHHVPQHDAADKLAALVDAAVATPQLQAATQTPEEVAAAA